MEKNNEASINNFCNELGSLNIYDHLDKRLNLDPNDNYELFCWAYQICTRETFA